MVLVLLVLCELAQLILMLIYETNYVKSQCGAASLCGSSRFGVNVQHDQQFTFYCALLTFQHLPLWRQSELSVWQTLHLYGDAGAFFFVYFVVMYLFLQISAFGVEIEG